MTGGIGGIVKEIARTRGHPIGEFRLSDFVGGDLHHRREVVDGGAEVAVLAAELVQSGVYAFIFSQKGLMAGLGLQGAKITQITPAK